MGCAPALTRRQNLAAPAAPDTGESTLLDVLIVPGGAGAVVGPGYGVKPVVLPE